MKEKLSLFLEKKQIRKDQCLILFLAGILLLVTAWPVKTSEKSKKMDNIHDTVDANLTEEKVPERTAAQECCTYWEERLTSLLSDIPGAGTVKAVVYMNETEEQVTLKDVESREGHFVEETVYVTDEKGRKAPFVVKRRLPRITGVLVAAQGAGHPAVEQNIRCAVSALFGIESDKIMVLAMN